MPISSLSLRRSLPLFIAAALAVLVLLVPVPGSLSVIGTRELASLGAVVPHVELVSEVLLVLLALATVASVTLAWFRTPARRPSLAAGVAGVGVAYAASEALKILFTQPRPCSRWPIAAECPPPGDWSLPSNHGTLAFAAAVVIAFAAGRSWASWAAVVLAVLVALGRVAQGVHYLHDVAAGAFLGLVVTAGVALAVGRRDRVRSSSEHRP